MFVIMVMNFNYFSTNFTFFDIFVRLSQSFPFFIIWLGTLIVWLLLECHIWASHVFNVKHTYINGLNRFNIFLTCLKLSFQKKSLSLYLSTIYSIYL